MLAELYVDLKGPKKKRDNWISIAEKCEKVIETYGSIEKGAEKLGISYELLRSIITLLTLPQPVKEMIRNGEILYDAAQRLARIKNAGRQIEVANVIKGLPSHRQREIIQYAAKYPGTGLGSFKKRVARRTKIEKIHIAIIPIDNKTYAKLNKFRVKHKLSLEKAILKILFDRFDGDR
jgi:hypothetical protein